MSKDKIADYDGTTAGNNTDIGGISIAEGMLPSAVNNSMRELTKQLGAFADGTDGIDVLNLHDDDASASIKIQAPGTVTSDTTLTLPDGDGADGQAIITNGSGTLAWAYPYGNRNLIINGSMACFQRATSATTMTNTYGAVDRFRGFSNGGGAFTGEKYDMTTSEIATTGHHQALKMLVSTADTSIAAAEYYALQYKFEGDDLQQLKYGSSSAQSFTVSFWVKSDTTGTYFLTVDKIANGQTAYRLPIEYTISSADTWEQKVITVSPTAGSTSFITSSAGAIGGGTGHGLSLYWGFAWGTDYHGTNNTWSTGKYGTNATANGWMGTVGNDFYITGVQLEVGEQATPFEHRSFGDELVRCQRYYQAHGNGTNGLSFSINDMPASIATDTGNITGKSFVKMMRASPTMVVYSRNSTANKVSLVATGLDYATSTFAPNVIGVTGFHLVSRSGGSNLTKGDGLEYGYTADAEL